MDFKSYQQEAKTTIQDYIKGKESNEFVPFLGLIGEAGSVITELKKNLRDGSSYTNYKTNLQEELGDVLWYISTIATQNDLELDLIAKENLLKTKDRFNLEHTDNFIIYDSSYPIEEQFPREFEVEFSVINDDGKERVRIINKLNDQQLGNELSELDYGKLEENQASEICFNISNKGEGILSINSIYLESSKSPFNLTDILTFPLFLESNEEIEYCVSFLSSKFGTYTNKLIIESNNPNNPLAKIVLLAEVNEPISNILKFPQNDELKLNTLNIGDYIEFSLISNKVINSGTFSIYSNNGKLIRCINIPINSNTAYMHFNRDELPRLSFIHFTNGEKVYIHKYLRD